jgi:thioredoxin
MTIVTCPNCGAKNRIDERTAQNKQPICGRCGTKLSLGGAEDSHPLELTDATFDTLLRTAGSKPVLVDCWAPWCGPCRMIAPTIEQLASESNGRWVIAKLNTDENQHTAARFHIDAIPAMLIFRDGQMVDQIVGLQPKHAIQARLEAQLSRAAG